MRPDVRLNAGPVYVPHLKRLVVGKLESRADAVDGNIAVDRRLPV
jgi:hypothetical protein